MWFSTPFFLFQYDSIITDKTRSLNYVHDRQEEENPEEMMKLLSSKADSSHACCESDGDDCSEGEMGDSPVFDGLNLTQVTEVDHSFQDKSNNNKDSLNKNVGTNSSLSSINGSDSSRSSSFLCDSGESSSEVTEQQLLVTLSSVPLHHLTSKPLIDLPKISVVGPNG